MTFDSDKFQLIFWACFFGFIFFYVVFRAPGKDKVYSSQDEGDVYNIQKFLEENGIRTYVKSKSPYRLKSYGGLANPSLHVMDAKDRDKALRLIESLHRD